MYVERRHVSLHWHDYCEWEIVLTGRGEQVYNARRYPMRRGTAYLLTQDDMHALRGEEDMELLKIQFHEYALPDPVARMLVAHRSALFFSLGEEELHQMVSLWEQIERELTQRRPLYSLLVQGAVTAAVVPLLRRVEGQWAPLPGVLQQAIAEVHTRFREGLTLGEVAAHCAVTPNYLGRLFSRWMRVSFSDYLNTVRLRYACHLLRGTGYYCPSPTVFGRTIAYWSTSNLYPTPHTVLSNHLSETPSSFSRRRLTCTSTVRESPR